MRGGIGCHGLLDLNHHRLRRIWHDLFPAATERLEQRDQIKRDVGGALRQLLFVLEKAALGIEHRQEVGDAVIVARTAEIERGAGVLKLGAQPRAADFDL